MVFRTKRIYSVVFAVFVFVNDAAAVAEEEISYYENLINEELEKAEKFELPTNANIHRPLDDTIRDFGTFDFVVIGAGSTGSVIASRLSEIAEWRILLLEAGGYPNNFTMIPAMFAIQALTNYNWGFLSTPQKTACLGTVKKQCRGLSGKGLGGTSLINELVYARGNKKDFNHWSRLLQDDTWDYENILDIFKYSEDFHKTNPDAIVDWNYHGEGGLLYTNHHVPPSNYTKLFLEANQELGVDITDYNGKDQEGATILQIHTKNGRRFDQATAFLKPAATRRNLSVSLHSYVTKIEISDDARRATGVIFTKNKKKYRVTAKNEIVLSAGVFSSPQILMLSGIGPENHLNNLGIPPVQNLQVGGKLRETVYCGIPFSSNYTPPIKDLREKIEDYLNGVGDLTAANRIDGLGFYDTRKTRYPDIEIVISSSNQSSIGQRFQNVDNDTWNALYNKTIVGPLTFTVLLLRSRSTGTLRLKSDSPYEYPSIDFNLLSDPDGKDIDTVFEGIQMVLNLTKTEAFRRISTKLEVEQIPGCSNHEFLGKDFWYCYIRHLGLAAYHPVGTCPMGRDPREGAVVDSNFKVFGVEGLRVADASVFPLIPAGHPNAVCTLVGEIISELLKKDHL
ncbi:glucose dehydrogenase [FAD, quinone]-like isoform X2 [Diorhabda sublineata]|uniref:glucose dehydrogenase [FAD, quinone]-like isoform X2 n=1 Tax=Diorhabda sublineata TaxID=1163346 RepID=UPI0024E0E17D|nr:glucose dehydrogenase [FAD, quinone]-like isoform X2 [Diorhabda sublineata]